ncbi:UNVERIFIED_CONTAM: hypothetical protein FKN15_033745 [Acipenser sinensis]
MTVGGDEDTSSRLKEWKASLQNWGEGPALVTRTERWGENQVGQFRIGGSASRQGREKKTGRTPTERAFPMESSLALIASGPLKTQSSDFLDSHYRLGLVTGSQLPTRFDPQRTERLIRSLDVRKKRESERTQIIVSYGTRALRLRGPCPRGVKKEVRQCLLS